MLFMFNQSHMAMTVVIEHSTDVTLARSAGSTEAETTVAYCGGLWRMLHALQACSATDRWSFD